MTVSDSPYSDPKTSPRESPLITAANTAKTAGASITGLINLAAMAGLVTIGVAGELNVAVGLVLGAVPVVVTVVGQLGQAAKIVRETWPKVTPVNSARALDAAGRLVALIPERPLHQAGPVTPPPSTTP